MQDSTIDIKKVLLSIMIVGLVIYAINRLREAMTDR